MKKMCKYLFCIPILIFPIELSYAQTKPLPILNNVVVNASVEVNNSDSFTYTYSVKNGSSSRGSIFGFDIDIQTTEGRVTYDTTGLMFKSVYARKKFNRIYPSVSDSIIPVSFSDYPKWWMAGITVYFTARFGGSLIRPGETEYGFTLISKGIPGIRKFKVSPWYDPSDYYPSTNELETVEDIMRIDSLVKRDRRELPVWGKTIGPKAPPKNFIPDNFLVTLQNYLTFSCDTTWIKNKGICRSLQAKLNNVEKQLSKDKFKQAVNGLQAFLNEVQAQKGKHLSSEAYALLYFNAKYLIAQLEKEK